MRQKATTKSTERQTCVKHWERLPYTRRGTKGQVQPVRPIRDNQSWGGQEQEPHVWRLEGNKREEEVAEPHSSIGSHWFSKQPVCHAGRAPCSLDNELCMVNHGVLSSREWPHQRDRVTLGHSSAPFYCGCYFLPHRRTCQFDIQHGLQTRNKKVLGISKVLRGSVWFFGEVNHRCFCIFLILFS